MMEIKVTITAPDLSEAINHMAVALSGTGKAAPAIDSTALNSTEDKNITAAQAPAQEIQQPAAPVAQTVPAAAPVATQPQQTAPAQPVTPAPVTPTAPIAPVATATPATTAPAPAAKTYTLDAIANAMAALIDEGKMAACMATIQKYGVPAINLLPKESYPAFAEDLKALGAKF